MSFTKSPYMDTYSTIQLPLIQSETVDPAPAFGGAVLNNMMVNVLPKKVTNPVGTDTWQTRTRHGVTHWSLPAGVTASQMRGLYVWEKTTSTTYYYVVIGTGIYTSSSLSGPWTAVSTFTNNNITPVRFTEFISSTNTKKLIVVDGIEGYVFTDTTAGTKIVDVDFPTPHVPFPIFLNGRLYLAKAGTGDIYCSDLDDPAVWTAGNFISSEVYPDDVQALVKINNYILAIGLVGCEYFYDAANAIGSPLARVENQSLPFGTDFPNSIASTLDSCVFLSKCPDSSVVLKRVVGFANEEIHCNFLAQILKYIVTTPSLNYKPIGHFFRDSSSFYYTLLMDLTKNSNTDGDVGLAYTYCFDAKMWVQFTRGRDTNRNTFGYATGHKTYPVLFSQSGVVGSSNVVAGNVFNTPFIGTLEENLRGVDTLCVDVNPNAQMAFLNVVTLSNLDFGTMNRKFMSKLGIDYVNESSGVPTDSLFNPRVSWWDTWGSSMTPVSLPDSYTKGGTTGLDFPYLYQLGSFRHRWIRVECYGMVLFRHIEVSINKGSS